MPDALPTEFSAVANSRPELRLITTEQISQKHLENLKSRVSFPDNSMRTLITDKSIEYYLYSMGAVMTGVGFAMSRPTESIAAMGLLGGLGAGLRFFRKR